MVFRGGLDVGIATLVEANEIYGPALTKAYRLESEVAEYPRFVVGRELLEFLESVENQDPKTELGVVARRVAAGCRRMIVQDTDGRHMLEFLGTEVRAAMGASFPPDVVTKGHDFVDGEYERFQKAGDEKLASRYFRLLQYYSREGRGGPHQQIQQTAGKTRPKAEPAAMWPDGQRQRIDRQAPSTTGQHAAAGTIEAGCRRGPARLL